MSRIIYFVAEAEVDGKTIQSEKFNQIVNPETGETIFDDVFQITEYKDFENYKDKEDFIDTVYEMAHGYFELYGDDIGEITVSAAKDDTNVLQWGVKIKPINDNQFEYTVLDWKGNGYIYKFGD